MNRGEHLITIGVASWSSTTSSNWNGKGMQRNGNNIGMEYSSMERWYVRFHLRALWRTTASDRCPF
jgi:hypothetical protein